MSPIRFRENIAPLKQKMRVLVKYLIFLSLPASFRVHTLLFSLRCWVKFKLKKYCKLFYN